MRNQKLLIAALAAGVAVSAPFAAWAKKAGHESQKGGLPALEEVVDGIEAEVGTVGSEVTTLMGQVSTLMGQVSTLMTKVGTLQTNVTDLQGQNNWAVIEASGTVNRFSSNLGSTPTVDHVASSGVYEVNFGKDVSGCAYEATIGDPGTTAPTQGQISVAGDVDGDSVNDVYVQTFDKTGATATDMPFHLYVSCN